MNIGLGLYERLWRYASVPDLTQVLYAGALGSIISVTIFYLVITPLGPPGIEDFPISFWVLEGLLSVAGLGGLRFAIRAAGETRAMAPSDDDDTRCPHAAVRRRPGGGHDGARGEAGTARGPSADRVSR